MTNLAGSVCPGQIAAKFKEKRQIKLHIFYVHFNRLNYNRRLFAFVFLLTFSSIFAYLLQVLNGILSTYQHYKASSCLVHGVNPLEQLM